VLYHWNHGTHTELAGDLAKRSQGRSQLGLSAGTLG